MTAASTRALRSPTPPVAIDSGALAHLRYIRETIEAAATFTSVPGLGCIAMGVVAFGAAALEWGLGLARLTVWIAAAPLAAVLAIAFMLQKARRQGFDLSRAVARRFFSTLAPALAAGGVLTAALVRVHALELVPGTWLLLYGAGLAASGVFSLPCVSVAGIAFMVLGTAAFIWPAGATLLLAAGFGAVHVALGVAVMRKHGG